MEKDPDVKFFLSNECYEYLVGHSEECENNGMGFRFKPVSRERAEVAKTLTTKADRMDANYVSE